MKEHKARPYGDQLHCHICGKQWDVNDPEPPECISEEKKKAHKAPGKKRWYVSRHR